MKPAGPPLPYQLIALPLAGGKKAEGYEHGYPAGKAVAQPEALYGEPEGKTEQIREQCS